MTTATESLYLTRIRLNLASRRVRIELADSQALHRRVMSMFPDIEASAARAALSILYRVDPPTSGQTGRVLLVQSAIPPRAESLPEEMLVSGETWGFESDAFETREVAPSYATLQVGQRLIFRLRANVTKRLWLNNPARRTDGAAKDELFEKYREKAESRGGKGSGPRVAIFNEEEQLAWLGRQGTAHGFSIEKACIDRGADQFRRPDHDPQAVMPQAVHARTETAVGWRSDGTSSRRQGKPNLVHNAVTFEGVLTITDAAAFNAALRTGIGPAKAYGFGLISIRPAH